MITFGQAAALFARSARRARADLELDLAKIGALAVPVAAEMIGHEMPNWAPLALSTVMEKEALGYTGHVSATDPLLREGTLRDSIKEEVEGLTLTVGSTDQVAVYQEMGTGKIPSRPFLGPALLGTFEHAGDLLGERAVKLLTPESR